MPRFKKTILPVGKYLVTRPNGSRTLKEFTADYLKTVAKNATDMLKAGLRIPAPFKHVKEAVPVEESPETNSFDNAGYWTEITVEEIDGQQVLCGIIDAPGEVDNYESPAGKLAHRIKEVSACIVDTWTDGKNRTWGPSILHGAAVVNPVVPDQKEFALLSFPTDSYILSASGEVMETIDQSSIAQLSKALEDNARIYLPPDTLPQDLVKVLLVSLKQHNLSTEQPGDEAEVVDTQSVFMSLPEGKKMPLSKVQAEELVKLGAINPKTNKPFTLEDFEVSDQPTQLERYALALTTTLVDERKTTLRKRINDLIGTGRTTKEFAETRLYPEIDKYELSLGDGAKFEPNRFDLLIESLEALPGKEAPPELLLANGIPYGARSHEGLPGEGGQPISKEDAEAMKNEMLKYIA
jgi:hypothetical protein